MKTRSNFVSNSSSSSFIMVGFKLKTSDEFLKFVQQEVDNGEALIKEFELDDEDDDDNIDLLASDCETILGFTIFHNSDGDGCFYIGREIDDVYWEFERDPGEFCIAITNAEDELLKRFPNITTKVYGIATPL